MLTLYWAQVSELLTWQAGRVSWRVGGVGEDRPKTGHWSSRAVATHTVHQAVAWEMTGERVALGSKKKVQRWSFLVFEESWLSYASTASTQIPIPYRDHVPSSLNCCCLRLEGGCEVKPALPNHIGSAFESIWDTVVVQALIWVGCVTMFFTLCGVPDQN